MRMFDARLGRFMSVDPLTSKFVFYTPYQYAGNKPIVAIDMDGLEDVWVNKSINADGYEDVETVHNFDDDYEATRAAWAKSMGVDVALLPKTGFLTTTVTYDENFKATGIQYSYSPTTTVSEYQHNIFVRFFNRLETLMVRNMGKTTGEWEGREGFEAYVKTIDEAGKAVENSAPLFGEFAPAVKTVGKGLQTVSDGFEFAADIEEKGFQQAAKNEGIRIAFSAGVNGAIDKLTEMRGGTGEPGADASTGIMLNYTADKLKEAAIKQSNDSYYDNLDNNKK